MHCLPPTHSWGLCVGLRHGAADPGGFGDCHCHPRPLPAPCHPGTCLGSPRLHSGCCWGGLGGEQPPRSPAASFIPWLLVSSSLAKILEHPLSPPHTDAFSFPAPFLGGGGCQCQRGQGGDTGRAGDWPRDGQRNSCQIPWECLASLGDGMEKGGWKEVGQEGCAGQHLAGAGTLVCGWGTGSESERWSRCGHPDVVSMAAAVLSLLPAGLLSV